MKINGEDIFWCIALVCMFGIGVFGISQTTRRMEITNQMEMPQDSLITIQGHTYKLCKE
jgi:hypothetical protein